MLKKGFLIGLVIMVLLSLGGTIGCGGGVSESPSGVVKAFYQAVNAGDLEKAQELSPGRSLDEEVVNSMIGKIEKVEIIDEMIAKVPKWEFGYEVWRAEVTVDVTLDPSFTPPTGYSGMPSISFLSSPFYEGKHIIYLRKHDPVYLPEWKGEWKIIHWIGW